MISMTASPIMSFHHLFFRVIFPVFVLTVTAVQASDAEQAFLRCLKDGKSSKAERQVAFQDLKQDGAPPTKRVAQAVFNALEKAHKALYDNATSKAIAREAPALRSAMKNAGNHVWDLLKDEKLPKETLNKAMADLMADLGRLYALVRKNPAFQDAKNRIREMAGYAQWCGLTHRQEDTLVTVMGNLAFMRNFVSPKFLPVLDFNRSTRRAISSREAECIARTNLHRIRMGRRPVEIDLRLVAAAKKHSEEMNAKNFFSHTSPTPKRRDFGTRALRDHAPAMSENIATSSNAKHVFSQWLYSVGHHQNMLRPGAATIGVGAHNSHWTQMFGPASILKTHRQMKAMAYVRERYNAGDDPEKRLKLSLWCIQNKLMTQAEDELEWILRKAPDHDKARKTLEQLRVLMEKGNKS